MNAGDDAPRAVPSDARHDGWYGRENLATHTTKAQLHYAGLLIGRLTALSLLIQWIVMHGRSSLMESFVWLLPFLCVQRKRERETIEKEKQIAG